MDLDDLHFLLGPTGKQYLLDLSETPITPENHLQIASQLRQRLGPAQTQAVVETALLRQLAAKKFSRAADMFFTRSALEQATSEVVSTYRARRFSALGASRIADLGCGIGGDSLALAATADVIGVEWDPVRATMALENVRAYGHGGRFSPLQADLMELKALPVDAVFFDPARRDDRGRRYFSLHLYQPPVSLIDRWLEQVPNAAVKIGPGIDYAELPEGVEIEFISLKGEVKEGVLWHGGLNSGVARRATLLPEEASLSLAEAGRDTIPVDSPRAILYEPDKAIIRAHLVEILAQRLDAVKIDQDIAYLTADVLQATPFARGYWIEDAFPFRLKALRHYLRARDVGHVTIKKRGSPLEPDMLRRQLRLQGDQHRVIFLTQVKGEAAVIISRGSCQGSESDS